jgi:NAD-dependent deacetylase
VTLAKPLGAGERILIFTGAGISTGSGIRDFRGANGVWKERQPVYFQNFMTSEAARVEYWEEKCQAWPSFRDATPNAVHTAIADLERAGKLTMVVTQNIDGLHHRGGTSAERLVELHGTTTAVACMSCHARTDPDEPMRRFLETGHSPRCGCGGYLKPATISFGQNLDPDTLARAATAVRDTDLVVALGSTLSVYPAAGVPLTVLAPFTVGLWR